MSELEQNKRSKSTTHTHRKLFYCTTHVLILMNLRCKQNKLEADAGKREDGERRNEYDYRKDGARAREKERERC